MFCIQCEQTLRSTHRADGCRLARGICGKDATTADLQDVLVHLVEGIAMYGARAHRLGASLPAVNRFVNFALFTTLTNVNFDAARFDELVREAVAVRAQARALYEKACADRGLTPEALSGAATWEPGMSREVMLAQVASASLESDRAAVGDDVIGLRLLVLYGLKGCAAYAEHAQVLGKEDDSIHADMQGHLDFLATRPADINALLAAAMAVGQLNLRIMALLDAAGTERFGHPEPTRVRVTPVKGKAILVSGHDLVDLEAILRQTEGRGINVYTHGEMLPATAYPGLKKYPHLVGNYGTAWQNQKDEFARFPGAVVMTSNCLMDPFENHYQHRLFTSGPVGWPGVTHIRDGDFGPAIAAALAEPGFAEDQIEQYITNGFARNTVMSVAGTVVDAVKRGDIRHFFVIGGCDGANPGRNYYTDFAEQAPDDTVVLTLGCGKFRFNRHDFGDIGGIPRLLDLGQCNDTYSALRIAMALAEAFDCGVNDLPLTLVISWFEQKAAAVLLTLLSLGIRNIHLGPTLPAFLTPNLLAVLGDKFGLRPVGDAGEDLGRALKLAS
ncbi:MAG: hydroxylamine reductase [Porticoccaceae bacterium]|jgi:hydroxylamine reductase|nr:hydroxylamine reductase [Porticoccaceae bacterium]MEA3298833.1 hydroxylamine reductase [Pseudomonadota bacterium]HLS98713.1 hydroxylamine reductase [Porticoccaceae bacterium]